MALVLEGGGASTSQLIDKHKNGYYVTRVYESNFTAELVITSVDLTSFAQRNRVFMFEDFRKKLYSPL